MVIAELFRLTGLSFTVLALIGFIGLQVLRYALDNLRGDPDRPRFVRHYLLTLLAVCVTVSSNNLLIFAAGWIAISLSLHQLLLFYPDRPRAALAAHKKFIFARLAEILLIIAFALLYLQHQTLNIQTVLEHYQNTAALTATDHLIACLIASVAMIKCAQLPLHGWLIQVVESPTPVSALLHAGIVNLGGFLLLLFAPLFGLSAVAKWLVLIVAGLSCVLAALVMMTRISIKVRLAWSTIAQMGLMLVECALGLYELALLHLVAHSCYKAYAFLSSGEAVNHYLRGRVADLPLPTRRHWLIATLVGTVPLSGALIAGLISTPLSPWVLISIACSTLLAFHFSTNQASIFARGITFAAIGVCAYVLASSLAGLVIEPARLQASGLADLWVGALFVAQFLIFLVLRYAPQWIWSQRCFVVMNAGFYLDEWSSRLTLWLWPLELPPSLFKMLPPQKLYTTGDSR
jgi:NAD(P)H-quinone oxidoreductase subunit 5